MEHTSEIINRVLPVLMLIGLGHWVRRSRFLPESTIDDLRKIAVTIALPSVLFVSFLEIELKTEYLVLFVVMFGLCVALFGLGTLLKRLLKIEQAYFPFLITGFEYGMLGISLFGSAYGLEKIGYIAVVDLGHEIFIWFVFLALLLVKRDGLQKPGQLINAFVRSPVIIGILAGLFFNMVGARELLYNSAVTGAVMASLQFLSNLTIPLILIIVGYGIKLDRSGIREALPVLAVRLILLIPLALVLNTVLIRTLLRLEPAFEAAFFTLLVLPPPFIVPLYMRSESADERRYVNNALTLYTLVSIILFGLYVATHPFI